MIKTDQSVKSKYVTLLIIGVLIVVFLVIIMNIEYEEKARQTQIQISMIRRDIELYRLLNERYPDSIKELFLFAQKNSGITDIRVYTLNPFGGQFDSIVEYSELNGKGGYFYDSKTGEVKININKPLGFLGCLAIGSKQEQIPSNW